MTTKLLHKLVRISPTPHAYAEALKTVKAYEKFLKTPEGELATKLFYIKMGGDIYAVGTFDRFEGRMIVINSAHGQRIYTPPEDVFETKQRGMITPLYPEQEFIHLNT
jgi:hypothetical protein